MRLLPPPARPPNDPLWFMLDGGQGWRVGAIQNVTSDNALALAPASAPDTYAEEGWYISEALDSGIDGCQWHRVTLDGTIDASSSVIVRTYTSNIPLPIDAIQDLPAESWVVHPAARDVDGAWDCLIRSTPGRYLWLQLGMTGTVMTTPVVASLQVEFPRISLRRYLPAVFGEDPIAGDFTDRLLSIFDTTLREIESTIDTQAKFFDPRSTPATPAQPGEVDFLTWLASWIGITADRRVSEAERREMVRLAPTLYDKRGTVDGLWRLLLAYLRLPQPEPESACLDGPVPCPPSPRCGGRPLNCDPPPSPSRWTPPTLILEHFRLRRWMFVGAARVGEQAMLWGRRILGRQNVTNTKQSCLVDDPFRPYASRFTVFVPACFGNSAYQRKRLETLLAAESPAHTQYDIEYVEPTFRIGVQSTIGLDAVIARYPNSGVTIGETALGGTSVLSDSAGELRDPPMRIGQGTRIGSTTRLREIKATRHQREENL